MKLNTPERWLVNNPVRALAQRFYEVPLLRRFGGRIESGRVLEVGCGQGVALPMLLTEFGAAHAHGVDLDLEQVRLARRRLGRVYAGRIDLRVAAVEQLPFADASFDAVFDFGILHHVPAWQSAVAEIGRVLKPGGTFFEEVRREALERWSYRKFFNTPRRIVLARLSSSRRYGSTSSGLRQRSVGFVLATYLSVLPGVVQLPKV